MRDENEVGAAEGRVLVTMARMRPTAPLNDFLNPPPLEGGEEGSCATAAIASSGAFAHRRKICAQPRALPSTAQSVSSAVGQQRSRSVQSVSIRVSTAHGHRSIIYTQPRALPEATQVVGQYSAQSQEYLHAAPCTASSNASRSVAQSRSQSVGTSRYRARSHEYLHAAPCTASSNANRSEAQSVSSTVVSSGSVCHGRRDERDCVAPGAVPRGRGGLGAVRRA
eukprot:7005038-Pyramimonas_sp.AAC.1